MSISIFVPLWCHVIRFSGWSIILIFYHPFLKTHNHFQKLLHNFLSCFLLCLTSWIPCRHFFNLPALAKMFWLISLIAAEHFRRIKKNYCLLIRRLNLSCVLLLWIKFIFSFPNPLLFSFCCLFVANIKLFSNCLSDLIRWYCHLLYFVEMYLIYPFLDFISWGPNSLVTEIRLL